MRSAQYKILRGILDLVPIPEYIHAFERGRSIPIMAALHIGQSTVISVDLKDFFTSIKQSTVQGVFQHLGIGEAPARTLSELCTYSSFVPQGALTSPKLSNIVSSLTFGPLLEEYCKEKSYVLSIYADDVTISFKEALDTESTTDLAKDVIDHITQCVSQFGFRVNRKKTKIMRPHQRQYVCGVVVNTKPNLQQKERRKLRAIVHNCQVNGLEAEALKNGVSVDSFRSKVGGRINWYKQLNSTAGTIMQEKFLACT